MQEPLVTTQAAGRVSSALSRKGTRWSCHAKITIPSDLRVQLQAFRVKLGTLANPCRQYSEEYWRAKLLRASATTLKFRAYVNAPCEASTTART
jgi:hypothetical protein